MKQLIIIGAGGLGREIADILCECKERSTGELSFKGFLDDNPSALPCDGKYKMLGCLKNYRPKPTDVFICAIGNPEIREKNNQYTKRKWMASFHFYTQDRHYLRYRGHWRRVHHQTLCHHWQSCGSG